MVWPNQNSIWSNWIDFSISRFRSRPVTDATDAHNFFFSTRSMKVAARAAFFSWWSHGRFFYNGNKNKLHHLILPTYFWCLGSKIYPTGSTPQEVSIKRTSLFLFKGPLTFFLVTCFAQSLKLLQYFLYNFFAPILQGIHQATTPLGG